MSSISFCYCCLSFGGNTDGGLYAATPVDPIFLFLPIFEVARMKVYPNGNYTWKGGPSDVCWHLF